ncbi:unnamed protein product [Lactuca virosa]|uniref:Uncharacterized protein n=1 Tax=Lactuca virosa TaxID=75947 RepID=A0AAU9P3F8_9ASTR|nr:unnamed protein product [Lactuca virosa]
MRNNYKIKQSRWINNSMDVEDRMNTHYSTSFKPSEIIKGQLSNGEEIISPNPLYTKCTFDAKKQKKTIDYNDPFGVRNFVASFDSPKYGSVTKDIENILSLRKQTLMPCFRRYPSLGADLLDTYPVKEAPIPNPVKEVSVANPVRDVVMFDDAMAMGHDTNPPDSVVIIGSDDDEPTSARPFQPYRDIVLNKPEGQFSMKQFLEGDYGQGQASVGKGGGGGGGGGGRGVGVGGGSGSGSGSGNGNGGGGGKGRGRPRGKGKGGKGEREGVEEGNTITDIVVESKDEKEKNNDNDVDVEKKKHFKGVYVGVDSDSDVEESNSQSEADFDGLADIWQEMNVGLESSKDPDMAFPSIQHQKEEEEEQECDHSFILKEDIGYVCRVCGVVDRSIESIIEFQRPKASKSTRTYYYEGRSDKGAPGGIVLDGVKLPGKDFSMGDASITAHPSHKKEMKPHQVEGFNFLLSNLVSEKPGGCILAHAPGSGKTFLLISFIQSYMAKDPDARPLVVLPRGILATWKKEIHKWQVEDIPVFDFYSSKADGRAQQLEVLKQWTNQRSILFLGYKQFSTIVCDNDRGSISLTCQEILLKCPTILILDEGHTPRNQDTDVLTSLEKVETKRKVVLSGTLYQNHVREVFNILNLVRPKFLKLEDPKMIKRRILSRVPIESRRNLLKKSTDNEFYELVEHTLLKDENFKRKVTVIEDLREMTSKVLHYYKGDFLDLPGHMDFSVFLNLSPRQKREVSELKKLARKFKISSDGSAIYVHPDLKSLAKNINKEKLDDNVYKIDELLENINEREGVKAKFFLNLLRLCESKGEKLLVFGQYLLPLKFLLRLTTKVKGWALGKQIFMITGDHDNDEREIAMDQFNNSNEAKVFFGSIKACGEGISLVGASRIIILDVHLNPSVTRQAIGRAFRPGQLRKVYTYRLIAANSPEEEDHTTCFKKESISKMWFEWNEYCGHHEFEMEMIDVKDCGDEFLETSWLNEDVTALYKRS